MHSTDPQKPSEELAQQVGRPRLTLDELLQGITDDNIHPETDTGPAVGREVW